MTIKQLIKRLKRLESGEYYCGGEKLFLMVANKSEFTESPMTGTRYAKTIPLCTFLEAFNEYKYGLEYATNGKLRYIGTNDLDILVVA